MLSRLSSTMRDDHRLARSDVRLGSIDVRLMPINVRPVSIDVRLVPDDVRLMPTDVRLVPTDVRLVPDDVRLVPTDVRPLRKDPRPVRNGAAPVRTRAHIEPMGDHLERGMGRFFTIGSRCVMVATRHHSSAIDFELRSSGPDRVGTGPEPPRHARRVSLLACDRPRHPRRLFI